MKLSLVLMVFNTSHLLTRTLETLQRQTLDDWELIIVDDMSEDDVPEALRQNGAGLPIQYHRLEHGLGMRGNTFSINYGVEQARGHVVMWSTPEVMLPPGALGAAYRAHVNNSDLLWVTIPSHGLTAQLQRHIDEVDWRTDIHEIKHLVDGLDPGDWNSVWFHLNFHEHGRRDTPRKEDLGIAYGNNQTVAVVRQRWLDTIGSFPLFCDYGCLSGETLVLTAGLRWVRNDSVKVGDYLVGVTETPAEGVRRKFEKSLVTTIGEVQLPSYRIITDDGQDIIASNDHQWLLESLPYMESTWGRTDRLKIGDAIQRITNMDVWKQQLAGLPRYNRTHIVHIEPVGIKTLIGMQTSTHTFIAEGLVSHNSDDPWISGERKKHSYKDLTLWNQEAYHQWHPTCQYWMALGKAPNWNKYGHTTSNLLDDPRVPMGGTCEIWDGGNCEPMSQEEIDAQAGLDDDVLATGIPEWMIE